MYKRNSLRIVVTATHGHALALKERIARIAPQITEVAVCSSPEGLREATRCNDYDAVLLDWRSGEDPLGMVAAAVKACPMIPVVVVSNAGESQASEQMLRLGAQDYLVKRETNGAHLVRALYHAIERKRLDIRLKTTLGELGQANARLKSLALKDPLTGALNRRAFFAIGGQILARARRHQRRLALLYCDMDGFKGINDSLGHDVGDAVLKAFSQRTAGVLRRGDNLARLGGDEFVILLDAVTGPAGAVETAERIREAFAVPLPAGERQVRLGLSIGVSLFPECDSLEELIRCADRAMYEAKQGAGVACFAAAGASQ